MDMFFFFGLDEYEKYLMKLLDMILYFREVFDISPLFISNIK